MHDQKLTERVRRIAGLDELSSPFAFAQRLRLALIPCAGIPRGAILIGRSIAWDASSPIASQRTAVGREFCRWYLQTRAEETSDERVASFFAAMFPYDDPPVVMKKPRLRVVHPRRRVQPQADASPQAPSYPRPELSARLL